MCQIVQNFKPKRSLGEESHSSHAPCTLPWSSLSKNFGPKKGYGEKMSFQSCRLHLGVPRPLHGEPGRALLADHSAGDFLGRPAAKVGKGLELDAALVPRLAVRDHHLARIVDPQLNGVMITFRPMMARHTD